jgi:hypothetical protein
MKNSATMEYENTETDTPRTDAARERYYTGKPSSWVSEDFARQLERELTAAKAEAKEWRRKYKDLDQGVRCEYCDPAGTIWECCTKRQKEQADEITRLQNELRGSNAYTDDLYRRLHKLQTQTNENHIHHNP